VIAGLLGITMLFRSSGFRDPIVSATVWVGATCTLSYIKLGGYFNSIAPLFFLLSVSSAVGLWRATEGVGRPARSLALVALYLWQMVGLLVWAVPNSQASRFTSEQVRSLCEAQSRLLAELENLSGPCLVLAPLPTVAHWGHRDREVIGGVDRFAPWYEVAARKVQRGEYRFIVIMEHHLQDFDPQTREALYRNYRVSKVINGVLQYPPDPVDNVAVFKLSRSPTTP
jgi:hypothetical protein